MCQWCEYCLHVSVVCRCMALCNLLVSPFLMVFLLIYFFLRNAEKFYHHPSSIGARRWSGLAFWRMREFNELPHYIRHRSAAPVTLHCHLGCRLNVFVSAQLMYKTSKLWHMSDFGVFFLCFYDISMPCHTWSAYISQWQQWHVFSWKQLLH